MRRFKALALIVPAVIAYPRLISAQIPPCPSYIAITQYPASPYNQNTASVTVYYGDDDSGGMCLSGGYSFNLSTFKFYVNGVNRTSYFNVGPNQATASALPVGNDDDINTWKAQITGWDEDLNPVTNQDLKSVTADWTPVATISTAPHEYGVFDVGRCAVDCFEVTTSYETVPYFVLDGPQNVTLVYHGDWARPRPIVQMDVTPPTGMSGTVEKLHFKVKVNGAYRTFVNGETALQYQYSTQPVRLKGQFDASDLATGVHTLNVEIGVYYAAPDSKWEWSSVSSKLAVVNGGASRFGRGWFIAGFSHLYEQADGSALIVDGGGSAVYFYKSCPTCSFATPNGAFGKLTVTGTAPNRTFTWATADSTKAAFNNSGYMTSVTARFGNSWVYVYSGSDLVTIRDPLYGQSGSHVISFAYGTYGLSSVTSQGARTTTVSVDSEGKLWRILAPDGDSTKFTYANSALGYRLISVLDTRGFTTSFDYTGSWKVWKVTAPTIEAYGLGNVQPQVVFSPWQDVGLPLGSTSTPVAPATPAGISGSVTDPEGRTTNFTVDKWGGPLAVTNALGSVTTILRSGVTGLPIRVLYPWGGKDSVVYNSDGLPTMTQRTGYGTVRLRYGAFGQVDSIWGDVPRPERRWIGTNGRVDWIRYASNATYTVNFTYNSRGQVLTMQDPSNAVRRWTYFTSDGNTLKDSLPGNRVTTVSRDSYGRVTVIARTGMPQRTVYYDVMNRIDSLADGVNGARTRFGYDGDLLARIQDAKGQVFRFTHNAVSWVTYRYDPADTLNRYDRYEYDRSGLVRRWTNRRNQPITLVYDALGRPTSKTGTNTVPESWGYSSDFRRMVAVGEITRDSVFLSTGSLVDSTVTWFCEPTCSKRFVVRNQYDTRGRRTAATPVGPGEITLSARSYSYNATTGVLTSLTVGGQTTSFGYDSRLLGTTITYPGTSNVVTRTFTSVANRSRILAPTAYSGVVSRDIELDTLRRVRAQYRDDNNGVKFTYDGLGRLAVARYQMRLSQGSCTNDPDYGYECVDDLLDHEEVFTYDPAGNRTDLGGTYNAGNRVSSFDGWTVLQDLDGNDTSKVRAGTTYKFKWTAEGRLDSAYANGTWHHLRYAPDGRLAGWDVGGTPASRLVWDAGNVLTEVNGAITSKVAEYSHYPGRLDAPHAVITPAGAHHVLHGEALGNVVATTDQSKNVVQQVTYGTWGKEETVSQPGGYSQRLRWKGALSLQPEIGLIYLRARWYDADLGRFESEDPMGVSGGANAYSFAGSDPANGQDPSGLRACMDKDDSHQHDTPIPSQPGVPWVVDWHDCTWMGTIGGGDEVVESDWLTVEGGSGGTGAPRGRRSGGQQPPVPPYNPVAPCPRLNSTLLRQLKAELDVARRERLERGGDYGAPWTSPVRMTAINRKAHTLDIPIRPGASGYWHVHWDPAGYQSPSWDDLKIVRDSTHSTELVRSLDSLFIISPNGTIVGCKP